MEEATGTLEGQVIASQFRILKKLGAGGMGAVYLAEQIEMDRKVVVKVLHPELTAMNPSAIERFRREAKAVAQLNHPNIVQVFVFGQADNGQMYLAMEYIEGRDLSVDLAAGPMPQPRALRILDQICAALVEAHGAGIVHRDLKPENVMLADRHGNPDYVKVLDFGIAKLHDSGGQPSLTQAGTVFGTPRYMSPEQVKGEPVDARSDIYALGVLFHEILTGRHPFSASTTIDYLMKHVNEPVPVMHEVYADLDLQPRVEAVVQKALAKDRADRYQSAAEMQRDVRLALRDFSESARGFPSSPPDGEAAEVLGRESAAATPRPARTATHQPKANPVAAPASRSRERRGVHPIVWVIVTLVVIGGIVATVFALRPKGPGPVAIGDGQHDPITTHGVDPDDPDAPDKPDKPDPDEPDKPDPDEPDEPAPVTSVAEGDMIDGFPLPKDVKLSASVASAEMYTTHLKAREVIGFYKAKLHGRYTIKPIPNGLQIEDEESPFSYINITAAAGDGLTLVLTRNALAEINDKPPSKMAPAFGVEFPDDAVSIVISAQAVVARSRKSFRAVCDFYANDPRYGRHDGVVMASDANASTPYCSIANTGSANVEWQAIAIVNDPTEAGAVMVTVAGKSP